MSFAKKRHESREFGTSLMKVTKPYKVLGLIEKRFLFSWFEVVSPCSIADLYTIMILTPTLTALLGSGRNQMYCPSKEHHKNCPQRE